MLSLTVTPSCPSYLLEVGFKIPIVLLQTVYFGKGFFRFLQSPPKAPHRQNLRTRQTGLLSFDNQLGYDVRF